MSTGQTLDTETETTTTTVDVKATGHVRTALGEHRFDYTFEGDTLREFLEAFFSEHEELEEMLIARTESESRTRGWARLPDDIPGTWKKNPEGEQTRPYARVLVNGKFNELLDGFETELSEDDRVALVYPFMYCC
jgi:molybdopterin converting factor small subunit